MRLWLTVVAVAVVSSVLGGVALAETKADNTVAVCGCGKVFVPTEQTEYLKVGSKSYACCSHECHVKASANPGGAAKMWNAAMTRFANGGKRTRDEIYADIQSKMGVVPTMFKSLPDETLEEEWNLFLTSQFAPGAIPNKYRELIGVAISGITKCQYCAYYHTEVAKLNGATDAEIEDAIHYAKSSAGWSTYINGLQIDFEQFKKEVDQACAFARSQTMAETH
jgi:AhpD family alkylhydroperoxidase